jgi:acyl CoA:acetate/3-ketoacid CoA transferase beta subunit
MASAPSSSHFTRADVCAIALAECFRDDGEILANPIGTLPMVGGRLARATFEPDLMMTDNEALLITNAQAYSWGDAKVIETYNPYRTMFDVVYSGRRHVIMGASQIDRFGNQNIAAVGSDYAHPRRQLIGFRGAPGNTVCNKTSYWIPNHSTQVFVDQVDVVTGIGWDRALAVGPSVTRFFNLHRVVTNLAVLDWETPDRRMRLRSVHPGTTVEQVVAHTGFELVVPGDVPESRPPTPDELRILRQVIDPQDRRQREIANNS